jgi:hypothetical protein
MKSFKQHITEGTKNTHLTHLADLSFEGATRINEAIGFLESLLAMFEGSSKSKLNVTRKWDGAPAVFCGKHPETGKFFVGTKSIFNKTPKINYTNKDIDINHGHAPGLVDKLKISLKHLPSLGIKGILQGDLLYGPGDVATKTIDGESYLTFTPNTITYAVQSDSKEANVIQKSKLGVVFHTKYSGKDMTSMKASFNVSSSDFGKSSSVWATDATYKDTSGKSTFTQTEYKTMSKLISKVKSMSKKASRGSDIISNDNSLSSFVNVYANSKVREGNYTLSSNELLPFISDKLTAKVDKLTSERGKEKRIKQNVIILKKLKRSLRDIQAAFDLNMSIQKCVLFLLNKIQEVQALRTYIRTADGFRVTSDEGFVVSDKSGTVIKMVDRLEFSKANFTVAKNWVKG